MGLKLGAGVQLRAKLELLVGLGSGLELKLHLGQRLGTTRVGSRPRGLGLRQSEGWSLSWVRGLGSAL